MLLHHLQEFDDHLRAWTNQHLALAGLLGIVDRFERIVENGCAHHCGGCVRFSRRKSGVRCLHGYNVSLQEPFERKECLRLQEE